MLTTPKGLSDEKAARMMAALREGQTLRTFKVRPPRLQAYFESHPEYAREALSLIEANDKAARLRKGARLRNLTHCIHGHPLSGSNISYEPNGRRKCLTCVKRRNLAPRPPTQQQIEQVTAALNAGKNLSLICHGRIGAQLGRAQMILSFRKLKLYRSLNPAFDRFVISATANNNGKAQRQLHHPERARAEILQAQNNDYYRIIGMMPSNLPIDVRDDVVQSIFVALLDGSLQRDLVGARIRQFVKEYNRQAKEGTGKYGHFSLDAPIFADGATTRGDTITRGLWD
jgi:hypothetical protein